MDRFVILLLVFVLSACSTRVEYTPPDPEPNTAAEAVNINIAAVTELEQLPYVGRKTAESIVAFREENGPFRRPEHLMLIRGISETRFIEIKKHIRTR